MLRIRLSILICAALAALTVAACGESSSSGDDPPGAELADLVAPGSVVFAEVNLDPAGELEKNADSIARRMTGASSLNEFIASEVESSARQEGESFDYGTAIERWLGERGGVAFERLIDGELSEPVIFVQTKDPRATQAYINTRAMRGGAAAKDVSYEGVDFKVNGSDSDAMGMIDEAFVLADSESEFKAVVDASQGESLGGEDRFQDAIASASSGSYADIYVDVGAVLEQSEEEDARQARDVLEGAGIDLSEATAVASVIPQSEQIEVDLSSDLDGKQVPPDDVSKLLGTLPAGSLAAFAFSEFGEQLEKAVDSLDESGVPPNLKPDELRTALKLAGIDIDSLTASLKEGAIFVEGRNRESLEGALILTSDSSEAADSIAELGDLLRGAKVPGVTAVDGKVSGLSIRSKELGDKPIVIVGKGNRVAIGYGLAPALRGLSTGSATLSGTPSYKAAVASLGKMPISAFADGPAAARLAEALVPRSKTDFWQAIPYLEKISYIGVGRGTDGELATAKLIAGVGK